MMKKKLKILFVFLITWLPALAVFLFIRKYSVNIPYMDQWDGFLNILTAFRDGSLDFHLLWAQHNEHRPLFPRIIMLLLALLSHWNVIWEQYFSLFLQVCTFLLILDIQKKMLSFQYKRLYSLFYIIASLLLFSMVQYENWSWGWQIQIFLNIFAVIFSIWAISKWRDNWLGLLSAIAGATIATYSFANGMILWILIFLWLLSSVSNRKSIFTLIWVIAAFSVSFSYIYGYEKPLYHPSLLSFLKHPFDLIIFFFSYIGSPFGVCYGLIGSVLIGAFGIFIFLYLFIRALFKKRNDLIAKYNPWIWLILYILLSAILTGIGRSGFSTYQALYSRYTSFSLLFWVALFAMVLANLEYLHNKTLFFNKIIYSSIAVFFSFLIFSHSLSYAQGIISFKKHFNKLSHIHNLLEYERLYGTDGNFAHLFPSMPELYKAIDKLRQLKMGAFYKEIKRPSGIYIQGAYFNIAGIRGADSFSKDNILILDKDAQVSLRIDIPEAADYEFLAELGFSPDHGSILIIVDGSTIGITDCSSSNINDNYGILKWVEYGKISLSKGDHIITIKSLSAPNIVNAIAIKGMNIT